MVVNINYIYVRIRIEFESNFNFSFIIIYGIYLDLMGDVVLVSEAGSKTFHVLAC